MLAPVPACATMTTTAYFGLVTGPNEANQLVACFPNTSAEPVFPASGYSACGHPANTPLAVPDVTTPCSAPTRNPRTSGVSGTVPAATGATGSRGPVLVLRRRRHLRDQKRPPLATAEYTRRELQGGHRDVALTDGEVRLVTRAVLPAGVAVLDGECLEVVGAGRVRGRDVRVAARGPRAGLGLRVLPRRALPHPIGDASSHLAGEVHAGPGAQPVGLGRRDEQVAGIAVGAEDA